MRGGDKEAVSLVLVLLQGSNADVSVKRPYPLNHVYSKAGMAHRAVLQYP